MGDFLKYFLSGNLLKLLKNFEKLNMSPYCRFLDSLSLIWRGFNSKDLLLPNEPTSIHDHCAFFEFNGYEIKPTRIDRLLNTPGVYMFISLFIEEEECFYIGQSANVGRRIYQHLNNKVGYFSKLKSSDEWHSEKTIMWFYLSGDIDSEKFWYKIIRDSDVSNGLMALNDVSKFRKLIV